MGDSVMPEEPKQEDKDARESEDNVLWDKSNWNKIKGFFLDNPTLALTLLYLYVTAVGMLYSAVLYGRFGINIFDYSEIADFLLAAGKNPKALLFTGAQILAICAALYWSRKRAVLQMTRRRRLDPEPEINYEKYLKSLRAMYAR
jgi:hypothetical protein